MLGYTFKPRSFRSFHNIMHQFYNEEEIFFSSRKRRSRVLICLVVLSVAVVLLLITSVVFVTLYALDHVTHEPSVSVMNVPPTNHSTVTYQSTARPKPPFPFTSQKPGGQLKYCGSMSCLLASIGRRKRVYPKEF